MKYYRDVSDAAEAWNSCFQQVENKTPFATFAWHETYSKTYTTQEKPFVLFDEATAVLAPFSIVADSLVFSGGKEISDYMDLIGARDNFTQAWDNILSELNNDTHVALDLYNVPESSPTYTYFLELSKHSGTTILTREDTTPIIELPDKFTTLVASLPSKPRHELQRKIRKFERENPTAQLETSQDKFQDIEALLDLMLYQDQKKLFLTKENKTFFRMLPHIFPDSLKIYKIMIAKNPVAIVVGYVYDNTFYLYNTGFDFIQFAGAGFYLHAKVIEQEILQGRKYYDFLQGNERYKYELGGKDKLVYRIQHLLKT
jgi:CelD/BcsL family acetyltransferase involved in cellulose biosynthesis